MVFFSKHCLSPIKLPHKYKTNESQLSQSPTLCGNNDSTPCGRATDNYWLMRFEWTGWNVDDWNPHHLHKITIAVEAEQKEKTDFKIFSLKKEKLRFQNGELWTCNKWRSARFFSPRSNCPNWIFPNGISTKCLNFTNEIFTEIGISTERFSVRICFLRNKRKLLQVKKERQRNATHTHTQNDLN